MGASAEGAEIITFLAPPCGMMVGMVIRTEMVMIAKRVEIMVKGWKDGERVEGWWKGGRMVKGWKDGERVEGW